MALQTDALRFHDQKMFAVTGMGIMTCTALTRHHRLMGSGAVLIHGFMTGQAEFVGLVWGQECSFDIRLVTSGAFPFKHGDVAFSLQETRCV